MSRLHGSVVATTRDGDPDDPLVSGLRSEGAGVLVWPTLAFDPSRDLEALQARAAQLATYDWIVFTSARAVDALVEHSGPVPDHVRVAAVGPATSRALRSRAWPVDLVGSDGAEGLARSLAEADALTGARVLFPAASRARRALESALGRRGALVDRVEAYHTRPAPPDGAGVRRDVAAGVDIVTFASPSAVRSLFQALGDDMSPLLASCAIVAIGPTTASAARAHGLSDVITASEATMAGMIDACATTLEGG